MRSAAGREWTDDGEVHEARRPKGGPRNAVRRVPIPPELVRLLREHVESYGTAPDGRLFWTYRGGIYQPSTLWQVLQKARAAAFPPDVVAGPLARKAYDFRHAGSPGGSTLALLARRWPSGQVTAWKCSTGSTRTASTVTTSVGTSGWRSSLASLGPGSAGGDAVISRTELRRWRQVHSAYIPEPATSGGFWRHMAAQPFSGHRIVSRSSSGVWSGQVGRPQ